MSTTNNEMYDTKEESIAQFEEIIGGALKDLTSLTDIKVSVDHALGLRQAIREGGRSLRPLRRYSDNEIEALALGIELGIVVAGKLQREKDQAAKEPTEGDYVCPQYQEAIEVLIKNARSAVKFAEANGIGLKSDNYRQSKEALEVLEGQGHGR